MNTEDDEFARIEREARMRFVNCGRCGEKLSDVHTCTPNAAVPVHQTLQYRLLEAGEIFSAEDQSLNDDCVNWQTITGWCIGKIYNPIFHVPHRRIEAAKLKEKNT